MVTDNMGLSVLLEHLKVNKKSQYNYNKILIIKFNITKNRNTINGFMYFHKHYLLKELSDFNSLTPQKLESIIK